MPIHDVSRRRMAVLAVAFFAVAAIAVALWYHSRNRQQPPAAVDMAGVLHANNLGVGDMEQFRFADAAERFRQVRSLAPDWLPGRINLGIALLNVGGSGEAGADSLSEVQAIFEQV